jgi:hypothetical protein
MIGRIGLPFLRPQYWSDVVAAFVIDMGSSHVRSVYVRQSVKKGVTCMAKKVVELMVDALLEPGVKRVYG